MWADIQTIRDTYQQIVQGERAWTALGDFLNYWHVYAADRRDALLTESPELPEDASLEQRRWAAFCAACVEHLCERDHVMCPVWVRDPAYTLPERWFTGLGASKPQVQARLLEEAPEAFRKHNVYCSTHAFSTKFDVAATVQQRQTA